MKRETLVFILISAAIILSSFGYLYETASSSALRGYIGDEVWYVPASRNVLHLLGVDVHYVNSTTGSEGVNVIFSNTTSKLRYMSTVEMVAYDYNATFEMEYYKFPGVYLEIPPKNLRMFRESLAKQLPAGSYYIVPGFRYPDKDNIQNYLNLEHSFLGKDLIMLGMMLGDRPIDWRLPGLIEFALIGVVVLLATYRISESYLASLIALVFVAADPTLQATALAAMLDIHVAFFFSLFILMLAYDRRMSAGAALGLAASAKLSGAFGWPVLAIKAFKEEKSLIRLMTTIVLVPITVFLIPNLTAIKAVGFEYWLKEFLASFRWNLSYKGPNPSTSPFWQWFVNSTPFPFHFNPNVYAQTDPFLLLAMVVFIFAIPWVHRRRAKVVIPFGVFWSTVAFFALQYALGGTTQFSFYATVLVPPAAVTMGTVLNEIIRWEAFKESLKAYWGWILHVKRRVRGVIRTSQ